MEFGSIKPRQRVASCCKKFAAFLFSQVGLATMVVAYSIMGGFLFRAIESPYEEDLKAEIKVYREQRVDEAWRTLTKQFGNVSVWNKTQFVEELMTIFVDFQDTVAKAVKEKGWDGKDESGEQWSFPGALLYAVTVITTIGYGHIAPKTNLGRFVTILYALVGIPLTFLYLSTIGNFLAHCFRIFYKRICCDICCCLKCERMKRQRQRQMQLQMLRQRQIDQYSDLSEMKRMTNKDSNEKSTASTNAVTNTYIAMPSGQNRIDGYGRNVSTPGGVRQTDDWFNIAEPDSASGKTRLSTTSAQAPRLRAVASGGNVKHDRVLHSMSLGSTGSQGDGKSKKKRATTRSRSVEDVIPKMPVRHRSTPMVTLHSTKSAPPGTGRSLSLVVSAGGSCDKAGVTRETSDLKRARTGSRLTFAFKRLSLGVKPDQLSEKTPQKRGRLWRSQSAKISKTKTTPEVPVTSENGPGRLGDCGGDKTVTEACVSNRGRRLSDKRERRGTKQEPIVGEQMNMRNGIRDGVIGHRASACVERSASFDLALRRSLQETMILSGSDESFVTATEDAPLYDDIYQSPSVFDCSSSVPSLPVADPEQRSKEFKPDGEVFPKNPPAGSSSQDYQHLAKNSTRIRFAESESSTTCRLEYADDEDAKDSKIRVPIYICLIVIASYILAGSVLFTLWEDWDLLTGSYFCFITLSTIGFGDIVPGTDMDKWDSSEKLVLCALWLALGLSLLAMCFNLMQEEVKEKCKWIAVKCGLIRNDTKL